MENYPVENAHFDSRLAQTAQYLLDLEESKVAHEMDVPPQERSMVRHGLNPLMPSPFRLTPKEEAEVKSGTEKDLDYLRARKPVEQPTISCERSDRDKEVAGALQEWSYPIHKRLQKVLGPALARLALRTKEYVGRHPAKIRKLGDVALMRHLPYTAASLPPDLFDHKGGLPYVPQTDQEAAQLINEWATYQRRFDLKEGSQLSIWGGKWRLDQAKIGFLEELVRLRKRGSNALSGSYDRKQWADYRQRYWRDIAQGVGPILLESAAFATYPKNYRVTEAGGLFHIATSQSDSFFLTRTLVGHWLNSLTRTPVGAYGSDFAEVMARTHYVAPILVEEDKEFVEETNEILKDPENERLLRHHLLRSWEGTVAQAVPNTAIEASRSVIEKICWLTHSGVPGYADPFAGMKALLRRKLVSASTALSGLAIVGPSALHGLFMEDILHTVDDEVFLSPTYIKTMNALRLWQKANMRYPEWQQYMEGSIHPAFLLPVRTGHGCPFKGEVTHLFAEANMAIAKAIAA